MKKIFGVTMLSVVGFLYAADNQQTELLRVLRNHYNFIVENFNNDDPERVHQLNDLRAYGQVETQGLPINDWGRMQVRDFEERIINRAIARAQSPRIDFQQNLDLGRPPVRRRLFQ